MFFVDKLAQFRYSLWAINLPQSICPAALGIKDQQPAAFAVETRLFYVPTNRVCMDYEPFGVTYAAGQPYVGATLSMYPPADESRVGNFVAWDARNGKIVWSKPKSGSRSGRVPWRLRATWRSTERWRCYFKAVDAKTEKELYSFKTPSGIYR